MSRSEAGDSAALSVFARAMQTRGRPDRLVDFPGVEGLKVRLWCPTDAEDAAADVESRKVLTEKYKLTALELSLAQETELARREREIELLAVILRDPEDPTQAFVESADELRDCLEKPQREALIASMEEFRRERFERHTPEETAEIVRLVKGLGEAGALLAYWRSCESDTQFSIVRSLIAALPKPTAPSSSGT